MPEIDTAHEAVPASEQAEKRTEETPPLYAKRPQGDAP